MTRAFHGVMLAAALIGCRSEADGGPSVGGNALCGVDEYALDGTLDGEAVSKRGTLLGHSWIQLSSPSTFDATFEGGGQLHTEWSELISDAETTTVTGSITMPPGAPRSGAVLEAATGAIRKQEDEVRFDLTALAQSVTCIAPPCPPVNIEGSVNGCVRWEHIGP